ncbi:hypothetical protein [Yinghuangia sp. YIM S09857]|uniref:hypothetical protein n=1 Tax=Yinghuangia sp. YIM S09857 TaxID=3436929 RepID=UPI003F53428F
MDRAQRSRSLVAAACTVAVAAAFGGGFWAGSDDDNGADAASAPPSPRHVVAGPASLEAAPPRTVVPKHDPELGTRPGVHPLSELPQDVRVLTKTGQRPDWSPDGRTIAFIDAKGTALGHVWTVDVGSGATAAVTEKFGGPGYSRAYYLHNGDLLLCGPTSPPAAGAQEAGRFTGVMSVLRAPFDRPPQSLGLPCWEGMAPSRTSLQIAWNRSTADFTKPADAPGWVSEIWVGELRYEGDRVMVADARKVADRELFDSIVLLEVQGFRPPSDNELILSLYGEDGSDVMALDLTSGKLRNLTNSTAYEEAEGITPTGDAVYVERELTYNGQEAGALDIWKYGLADGSWQRITFFNRYAPHYASNPSVSPDGRQLAYQLSYNGEIEGQGNGILLQPIPSP